MHCRFSYDPLISLQFGTFIVILMSYIHDESVIWKEMTHNRYILPYQVQDAGSLDGVIVKSTTLSLHTEQAELILETGYSKFVLFPVDDCFIIVFRRAALILTFNLHNCQHVLGSLQTLQADVCDDTHLNGTTCDHQGQANHMKKVGSGQNLAADSREGWFKMK